LQSKRTSTFLLSLTLIVIAFILLSTNTVLANVPGPGQAGGPPSPINTTYFNQKVSIGEAIPCDGSTFTRFLHHFSGADLTPYNQGGIPSDTVSSSNINVNPWTGYYVCPGTTYRYNSDQWVSVRMRTGGRYSSSQMSGAVNWERDLGYRQLGGTVNSGSGSNWTNWGSVGVPGLTPGWNTIALTYRAPTCIHLPSGTCSGITGVFPIVRWIYYQPPPVITAFTANCSVATVTATTYNNARYDARLLIDLNGDGDGNDAAIGEDGPVATNIASGASANLDTTSFRDLGSNSFFVRVRDRNTNQVDISQIPRTVAPCLVAACDVAQIIPSPPEPGQAFTVRYRFKTVLIAGGANAAMGSRATARAYTAALSVPGVTNGTGPMTPLAPTAGTIGPSESGETAEKTNLITTTPGPKPGTVTISGLVPNPLPCPLETAGSPVIQVLGRPYLRVYGGDVHAGSGFGSNCTLAEPSAKILTFNQGATAQFNGAGTNIAAFAKDVINGFASASGGASARALSFSNRNGVPNSDPTYGGGFGAKFCAPNYWADAPTSLPPPDLTPPTVGQHKVVYWEGDVTIGSDIIYPAWITKAEIPSYYLIVNNGNIYINNSVRQLDGVYVALSDNPTDTKGRIYTCNPSISSGSYTASDCSNKLTINGAFVAKQVQFLRTTGTVGAAGFREPSTNPNIAEVFVYGPELWVR
jgi:hypothetical protein